MSAEPPFKILATLDTGPLTNHVALVENAAGKFAYVSIGAENEVKVFRRDEKHELVATIPTRRICLTESGVRAMAAGFMSGLRTRMRFQPSTPVQTQSSQLSRSVSNRRHWSTCQMPCLMADGSANLTPLGDIGKAEHLKLAPPPGNDSSARATVSVNSLGALDLLAGCRLRLETYEQLHAVVS